MRHLKFTQMAIHLLLASGFSMAGTGWVVDCKNINCILHEKDGATRKIGDRVIQFPPRAKIRTGGGMVYELISGYCPNCKKIINLSWPREDSSKQPTILGTKFDEELGCKRNLYQCSNCKNSMIAFDNFHNYKKCPICYTDNFSKTPTYNYD